MNICIVAGARPNFIKVAPIIRAVRSGRAGDGISLSVVYAGSADDPTLEDTLFRDLGIARPDVCLDVVSENLNEITGGVMREFERYLAAHPTDVVIVVDDLASTMAAAIVTKKRGILLAHLAAGTRSFDINMPKEINRLVTDGLSDLLFTAGMTGNSIAGREGADQERVHMVGNLLMDNIRYMHTRFTRPGLLEERGIADRAYIVLTLNRRALIGDAERLGGILRAVMDEAGGVPVLAPLRGLAAERVGEMLPEGQQAVSVVAPMNYPDFGYLTSHARGIVTDSGNVAEEATFYSVPCITLGNYTEHIETVTVGSNVLAADDDTLRGALADMVAGRWKQCALPESWDGRTAERILRTLTDSVGR